MGSKFLIIDDGATERHLLTKLLEELGHKADTAETTEGAIPKIAKGNYSAVFLDIVMPDEDGYKFLRNLRANADTSKQYVILCSTKRTKLEIEYGMKRGADDYLPKPVTKESLQGALQKLGL